MDFTIPFYWIAINILPLQLNKYHVSQLYRKQSLVELSIVSRRYVIGIKIQILFLQEDQLFTDCMIHGEVQGKVKDQRWRNCGKTSIVAKNIFECCIQLFSKVVAGFINHYDFPTETPILSDYQKCCFRQIKIVIFLFSKIFDLM